MKSSRGWADDAPGNEKVRKRRTEKPDDPQRDWSKPMPGDFITMAPALWLFEVMALSKPAMRLALYLCWRAAKDQYRSIVMYRRELMTWGMNNRKLSETLAKMKPLLKVRPTSDHQKVKITFRLPEEFRSRLKRRKSAITSRER